MPAAPLRILVVLPMYGGSLPIGRYCASALGALGHSVRVFEAPLLHPAFTGLRGLGLAPAQTAQLENSFLQVVSQAVWAQVQAQEPHLVLAMAQAPLSRNALHRLRKDGVTTAMWFVEDHAIFTYWRAYAPLYDFFAVIQKDFLAELAALGTCQAMYLPVAMQPSVHRPLVLDPVEKRRFGSEVSFVGAGYPNRRLLFRRLLGFDFKIWGTEWDGEAMLAERVQKQGTRVSTDETVKIFNATQVNINIHSSLQADQLVPKGDFVNPRTFELAGCRAFQLVDRRALLPELFDDDELATFESPEELLDKLVYYLARPEERAGLAERAYQRAMRDHTYAKRMDTLLTFIKEHKPGWPAGRKSALDGPDGLPRPELAGLLERLGLPGQVSFADLVAALRQRQGALAPEETAVLFLDEWQKLYKKSE